MLRIHTYEPNKMIPVTKENFAQICKGPATMVAVALRGEEALWTGDIELHGNSESSPACVQWWRSGCDTQIHACNLSLVEPGRNTTKGRCAKVHFGRIGTTRLPLRSDGICVSASPILIFILSNSLSKTCSTTLMYC